MNPKALKKFSFYIEAWQKKAIEDIKISRGPTISTQIRAALDDWLKEKGFVCPKE